MFSSDPDLMRPYALFVTFELQVFHLSSRSCRNKLEYIEDIALEYDVIRLTVTHLDMSISTDDVLLGGFSTPFRQDRRDQIGGGVMVYI